MVRHHHRTTVTTTTTTIPITTPPPKRKKGRPSLHEIQQRQLLQQRQQQQLSKNHINPNSKIDDIIDPPSQNPNFKNSDNPRIRSSRRSTSNVPAQFLLGSDSDSDSDSDQPNSNSHHDYDSGSDSDDERIAKKIRRLSSNKTPKIAQEEKGSKATDRSNAETRMLDGPTNASVSGAGSPTALPDRKLLLLVLDKLQKKDTRGVFAEPVDPEELPDYHEIIESPMDFGTVRSKLDRGRYKTLEEFEDDVSLISSNAMQYNPPSTIFFRQARSIQEIAKKEFETLRNDAGLRDLPQKPRRGRPPGSRNLKKLLESSPVTESSPVSESPPEPAPTSTPTPTPTPTPVSREDDSTRSGSYNLRKGPSLYRFPRKFDKCFDLSASSSRYMSTRYGKKPCEFDENRRDTYYSSQFDSDPDTLAVFGGSDRRLIPVGPGSDNNYARSLARFAANLGPVVWSIVSTKLRSIIPPGVDFGPGWVEETKTLSTQFSPLPDKSIQSTSLLQDSSNSKPHNIPLISGLPNSTLTHTSSAPPEIYGGAGEISYNTSEWSLVNGIHPGMNNLITGSSSQFHDQSLNRAGSSSFGNPIDYHGIMNPGTDGTPYWKNISLQERWGGVFPSELNGGFQVSNSRNSSLPMGSSPQLDLVLQL